MSRLFGACVQTAYVVPDMNAFIERWLGIGIGPFYILGDKVIPARYRGKRHDLRMSAAFVYSGSMMYEIVEQHDDTPSVYRDFLKVCPQGGLHHLAYYCDDFEHELAQAKAAGHAFTIAQEFIAPDEKAFEIYIEPVGRKPDTMLAQLMLNGVYGDWFTNMERISASWDGTQPIRDAMELIPAHMRPK